MAFQTASKIHWLATDRRLWQPENYREFVSIRRELLAKAANTFLDELDTGVLPDINVVEIAPQLVDDRDEEWA